MDEVPKRVASKRTSSQSGYDQEINQMRERMDQQRQRDESSLRMEIESLKNTEFDRIDTLEVLRIKVEEAKLKIQDAQYEKQIEEKKCQDLLNEQATKISELVLEKEKYISKLDKSKQIGLQMQTKKDKYQKLHEIIKKSTAEAVQGIDDIKARNMKFEEEACKIDVKMQHERKKNLELQLSRKKAEKAKETLDHEMQVKLLDFN